MTSSITNLHIWKDSLFLYLCNSSSSEEVGYQADTRLHHEWMRRRPAHRKDTGKAVLSRFKQKSGEILFSSFNFHRLMQQISLRDQPRIRRTQEMRQRDEMRGGRGCPEGLTGNHDVETQTQQSPKHTAMKYHIIQIISKLPSEASMTHIHRFVFKQSPLLPC